MNEKSTKKRKVNQVEPESKKTKTEFSELLNESNDMCDSIEIVKNSPMTTHNNIIDYNIKNDKTEFEQIELSGENQVNIMTIQIKSSNCKLFLKTLFSRGYALLY